MPVKSNMARFGSVMIGALMLCSASTVNASLIGLSFSGTVDSTGASVGGVAAAPGSPFTLDITIDDSMAAVGVYAIDSISYTTSVGTYNTISNWTNPLTATPAGPSITLMQTPVFEENASTEHFKLDLTNFGPSSFNNPLSWTGAAITGDIIVRGLGGFDSPDQLSGIFFYTGTLALTVPEPGTLALFGLGLASLGFARRGKTAA